MTLERLDNGRIYNPQSLEINVTHHCNLSCRACSHLSPVFRRAVVDPDTLFRALSDLAQGSRASACKLLGGEPLLHPNLPEVIRAVRASRIADRIQVCTNGVLLPRMADEIWELIDEVLVSHYPSRSLDTAEYPRLQALATEHGVGLEVSYFDHFRESYAEVPSRSPRLVERIYRTCKMAHVWFCHTVYHFFKCPQSIFIDHVVDGEAQGWWRNGLEIETGTDFRDRLWTYLHEQDPLSACQSCLGTAGRRFPHRETPRKEWREAQDRPVEDLVDRDFLQLLETDPQADEGCVRNTCPMP